MAPWLAAAGCVLFVLFAGCETQTRTTRTVSLPSDNASPTRAVLEAPSDLHDLSGFLLRHRIAYGKYPSSLAALRESEIMPASGYEGLGQYAYSPYGLGELPSGDKVMVVDRTIRIAEHVWCVLEINELGNQTDALDVRLVEISVLRNAAGSTKSR